MRLMNINIKATGIALTPAIESYLREKLAHLEKFLDPADPTLRCEVEVGRTTQHHRHGDVFKAEINLHLAGRNLYAANSADDLYAAIDLVKDEIASEIKTFTKKRSTLLRRGGRLVKDILRGLYPWKKKK